MQTLKVLSVWVEKQQQECSKDPETLETSLELWLELVATSGPADSQGEESPAHPQDQFKFGFILTTGLVIPIEMIRDTDGLISHSSSAWHRHTHPVPRLRTPVLKAVTVTPKAAQYKVRGLEGTRLSVASAGTERMNQFLHYHGTCFQLDNRSGKASLTQVSWVAPGTSSMLMCTVMQSSPDISSDMKPFVSFDPWLKKDEGLLQQRLQIPSPAAHTHVE
ncbi:hypothetical protein WISP_79933 [Willisornis vidua]|uniref:Uncharacterized protein n=1 Tax=Willisornis vidua TaxID=1566151 RepID=A0ABQ9D629_9PASS|nr:hypothetical protein WISP_79933 [Willisornis vidua]